MTGFIFNDGELSEMDEKDQAEYEKAVESLRKATGDLMPVTQPGNLLSALVTTLAYMVGFLIDQCGAQKEIEDAVIKDYRMVMATLKAQYEGESKSAH